MTAFDAESSKHANEVQHRKYKDLSAEMRRRANLRKTHSGNSSRASTTEEYSQRAKLGWKKRKEHAKSQEESASKDSSQNQSYDRTQEV